MARIIDGRAVADRLLDAAAAEVALLRARHGRPPGLAVVSVADGPESTVGVGGWEGAAVRAGFHAEAHRMPAGTSMQALRQMVEQLNRAPEIDGIFIKLPLPEGIDVRQVLEAIGPDKDVDGRTDVQAGRLLHGTPALLPCAPAGVMELLRAIALDPKGKDAVVVGRGAIVGKAVAQMLIEADATVTVAHTRTRDLAAVTCRADILVVAAGTPGLVGREHIKPGGVVIDVGLSRVDGRLVGDVRLEEAQQVAGWLAPVPGGVGPVAIAVLMRNTVEAMRWRFSASVTSPAS